MRKLSIIVFVSVLLVSSCMPKKNESPCATVMCTAIFAAVAVQVIDANGAPVVLDEVYTERIQTNEHIRNQQTMAGGYYIVLDDSYRANMFNSKVTFRFVGRKNGTTVADETYIISADCCHVRKESGKEIITVN